MVPKCKFHTYVVDSVGKSYLFKMLLCSLTNMKLILIKAFNPTVVFCALAHTCMDLSVCFCVSDVDYSIWNFVKWKYISVI